MKLELTDPEVSWLLTVLEEMNGRREFTKGSTGRTVLFKVRRLLRVLR